MRKQNTEKSDHEVYNVDYLRITLNKIILMSKIIADTGTEVSVYSLKES